MLIAGAVPFADLTLRTHGLLAVALDSITGKYVFGIRSSDGVHTASLRALQVWHVVSCRTFIDNASHVVALGN
jgi:hypothetical protein